MRRRCASKGVPVVRRQRNIVKEKKIEGARAPHKHKHTHTHILDYTVNRETEKEGNRRDSLHEGDEGGRGEHGGMLLSPGAHHSTSSRPLQRRESPLLAYPLRRSPPGSYDAAEGYARHASDASRMPIASSCSHTRFVEPIVCTCFVAASCRSRFSTAIVSVVVGLPRSSRLGVSGSDAYQIDICAQHNDRGAASAPWKIGSV